MSDSSSDDFNVFLFTGKPEQGGEGPEFVYLVITIVLFLIVGAIIFIIQ